MEFVGIEDTTISSQCRLLKLPELVVSNLLGEWLEISDLVHFDSAIVNTNDRELFLKFIGKKSFSSYGTVDFIDVDCLIRWLELRNTRVRHLCSSQVIADSENEKMVDRLLFPPCLEAVLTLNLAINASEYLTAHVQKMSSLTSLILRDYPYPYEPLDTLKLPASLTNLSIHNSYDVDDDMSVLLLKQTPALESLTISYCAAVLAAPLPAQLLTTFRQVKHLNLDGYSGIVPISSEPREDLGDPSISGHFHHLVSFSLNRRPNLLTLVLNCRQLATLCVAHTGITDDMLVRISGNCSHTLTSLDVNCCPAITDTSLLYLTQNCKGLQQLNVSQNPFASDASVASLALMCPLLRILDVSNCPLVTEVGLGAVAEHCSLLEVLNACCSGDQLPQSSLVDAAPPPSTRASASQPMMSDAVLATLAQRCPNLREIRLAPCVDPTDVGLVALALGCPWLTVLDVSGCSNLTDVGLQQIVQKCAYLEYLDISICSKISDLSLQQIAQSLKYLVHLRIEHLVNISAEGGVEPIMQQCHKLKVLSADGCVGLTAETCDRYNETYGNKLLFDCE
mmetsp:Transcript_21103/g.35765  ORF Transcript_21103/g.35765 Transcript_21103/m.35765 type:complete len:565 (+) Transcript_21103:2-1696(+)